MEAWHFIRNAKIPINELHDNNNNNNSKTTSPHHQTSSTEVSSSHSNHSWPHPQLSHRTGFALLLVSRPSLNRPTYLHDRAIDVTKTIDASGDTLRATTINSSGLGSSTTSQRLKFLLSRLRGLCRVHQPVSQLGVRANTRSPWIDTRRLKRSAKVRLSISLSL